MITESLGYKLQQILGYNKYSVYENHETYFNNTIFKTVVYERLPNSFFIFPNWKIVGIQWPDDPYGAIVWAFDKTIADAVDKADPNLNCVLKTENDCSW